VPIVSFVVLKARCGSCLEKISWQYPIVEVWTGLIFLSIYSLPAGEAGLAFSILQKLILISVFCLYIVITIYDFRHKIIPDQLVIASIIISFLFHLISDLQLQTFNLLDWLAGPILFSFFGLIWLLSGGRAMGFGDAKLGLSVGLLLGATNGFSAIVLAFWIGAAGSLVYLLLNRIGFLKKNKGLTMKSEVPFAPFIVLGTWLALILELNLLHVPLF
jgi:prepilin signal peptidase PulO-like enzyme (type II secretory pathway)